jgi:hypothetical protein
MDIGLMIFNLEIQIQANMNIIIDNVLPGCRFGCITTEAYI